MTYWILNRAMPILGIAVVLVAVIGWSVKWCADKVDKALAAYSE